MASDGRATALAQRLRSIRRPRRLRWPLALCGVLVLAAIGVVLFLVYDSGAFVRGPAVDAASAYVTDVREQRYSAAYALLAPDLRSRESEQSYAEQMQAIDASDGRITGVTVLSQQADGSTTIVQLNITRTKRGTFPAHFAVVESNGVWLISADDDL